MDRPEPGLIKWSPTAALDSFIHINLQHRVVQVYEPTGHARRGRFDFKKVSKHDDFPPLTTYDWSPSIPNLVAVGTSTGVVNLLRVDDGSNAYTELNLKMSRTCQAVSFSTAGMLAVGLDRVRSDNCLHLWDVNRLSSLDTVSSGLPADMISFTDPVERLEPSVSVSSVRFFEDNPNILVAGIKGQGLRMHDLRNRGHTPIITFQTKCCNNLAIDYADQNYFASSALDQPGIMIWDRRAISRQRASVSYLDAIDHDDVPWGGALKLDRAMQMETDPALMDSKNSFIRSLRFCRDHRGMLAVLSRTGQLRVLSTRQEHSEQEVVVENSPGLLEVTKSYDMDPLYFESSRKNDKIVSFDWVTLGSSVLRPRLLVLRANGAFDILEKPPHTSDYLFKLIPWQAPHRGLEGGSYHDLMEFDASQGPNTLAPLFTENLLSDIPLFGPDRADVDALVEASVQMSAGDSSLVVDELRDELPPLDLKGASSVAEKLRALELYSREHPRPRSKTSAGPESRKNSGTRIEGETPSPRELHERFLSNRMDSRGLPGEGHVVLDHIMLLRAKEMYLFNCETNQKVVADDPYLQDVWAWVAGAEKATDDGGMMSHPLDLSYMGVYSIWMNDLGSRSERRLSEGASRLDTAGWEGCLNAICKKLGVFRFETVQTKRPHHRQLCLTICNWGRATGAEHRDEDSEESQEKEASWHTMEAARALFRGDASQAVRILKKASTKHPELLFVSLALQLIGKGDEFASKEALDFDERVASKTDPYLRAISSIIATGNWANIANQRSLPLRDRLFVAVRNFADDELTAWLERTVQRSMDTGDLAAIVLTGITDPFVDILARYVEKFNDYQTATLLLSFTSPRFVDDIRAAAFRRAYTAYLQRHRAFLLRAKFGVESTRRSKHRGLPTLRPPPRQIALRCVYCDAETSLGRLRDGAPADSAGSPFADKAAAAAAGIYCRSCRRQLPRCAVCLEVVGTPRADGRPAAARFPTFCLRCEHVLHLDHARQWFARHGECPVPECRCKCNFRANPELNYR